MCSSCVTWSPSRSVQKHTYWSKRSTVPALLLPSALGRTLHKRSVGAGARGKRGNFWSKRSQGGNTGATQHWQLANQVILLGRDGKKLMKQTKPILGRRL